MSENTKDCLILVARIFLMVLFIIFGWWKLANFDLAVSAMQGYGAPMPYVAAIVAVAVELFLGIVIILGVFTRPVAALFALYVLGTSFIGHPYWKFTGMDAITNEINFYKNLSIIGGLLLLIVTGAGRYSLDYRLFSKR